jgi:hypothetical protein
MSALLQRLSRLPDDLPLTLGARVNVRPEEVRRSADRLPKETVLRFDATGALLVQLDDGKLFYDPDLGECKTASDQPKVYVKINRYPCEDIAARVYREAFAQAELGLPYATEPAKFIDDHVPPCPPAADQGLKTFKVGECAFFGIGHFLDGTHDLLASRQRIVVKRGIVVNALPASKAYLFGQGSEPKGSPYAYYVHDTL